MAKLSPVFNDQTVDINGNPLSGAKLFTYAAGSSTKIATFTDSAGLVPQTNPIILNSLGYPTLGPIWLTEGVQTKFVLAPATDTDPPTSPIRTIDNVQGVNDSSTTISQWTASGVIPTYVSASSFTLVGDQTSAFQPGRREQFTTSGGTVYGNILTSVFTTLTTVTMQMDGGQVLDSGLSAVNHSILLTSPSAEPSIKTQSFQMGSSYGNYSIIGAKGVTVASAATTPIFGSTDGNTVDISGSFNGVTSLGSSGLTPGYTMQGTILGTPTFTPSANLVLNGGGSSITANAGDKYEAYCDSATLVIMTITRSNGTSIASSYVPARQTVIAASVDTSGLPNFMSGTTTTTLTISGSSGTPFVATSSNGISNRIGTSIANLTLAGQSTNGTFYDYVDISVSGVMTLAAGTLAPVYQWGGTPSVTNGQFTFNIQENKGYVGNGASAVQADRIYIGEHLVAANVISTVTPYALMGRYVSAETATLPGTSAKVSSNHNIGTKPKRMRFVTRCTTIDGAYSVGDEVDNWSCRDTGPIYSLVTPKTTALAMAISTTNNVPFTRTVDGGGATFTATAASWAYRFEADRGW